MINTDELPRPQKDWGDLEETLVIPTAFGLRKIVEELRLPPSTIKTVTILGAGRGTEVKAALEVFSQTTIHAIDFHDLLPPPLKADSRVAFHQGLFIEVLKSSTIPPADITLCKFMGRHHGFDPTNIALLQKAVGDGFLIMGGDNNFLEMRPYFRDSFALVKDFDRFDATAWKVKKEGNEVTLV